MDYEIGLKRIKVGRDCVWSICVCILQPLYSKLFSKIFKIAIISPVGKMTKIKRGLCYTLSTTTVHCAFMKPPKYLNCWFFLHFYELDTLKVETVLYRYRFQYILFLLNNSFDIFITFEEKKL